jgi:prepilin-type N-terminal cleavage/methylation domain-containing protein
MGNRGQWSLRTDGCRSIHPHFTWSLPSNGSIGGIPNSKGFTLIEIIMVIVIISIIAGIAAMIILQGVRGYSDETQRSNLHYQARLAVERVAREARLIRSCADITGPANPSNTLSFTDVFGNPIAFSVAGTNLNRVGNLLANNITSPTPFRFLDQNGNVTTTCSVPTVSTDIWFVEIDLTDTQGSETLRMRTRVHPMNF